MKNILITGASSGLGRALAIEYSDYNLFLISRNEEKLKETIGLCKNPNNIKYKILDVCDKSGMEKWISTLKLDLVIANAGVSGGTLGGDEDREQIDNIFSVNFFGVLNTIEPAIKSSCKQVAIISSLAGYRGLPSAPAYSASKGAVRLYGEALRGSLKSKNIKVSVVTPGYIITPMTDKNKFYMPGLMKPQKAAKKIRKGLNKNKSRIAFPFYFYFLVWFITLLSPIITDPIFSRLPKKG